MNDGAADSPSTLSSVEGSSSLLLDSVVPFLFRIGSIAVGLIAVAASLLYAKQDNLLYFPEIGGIPKRPSDRGTPRGYRSPAERQFPFEELRITCEDGVEIHAWLLLYTTAAAGGDGKSTVPPGTPTILFFHGNAGHIGLRLPNAMQMVQYAQANVMLVEYRGYGESDNVPPNEEGLKLDAQAAISYASSLHPIRGQIDPSRIYVFGRSLGGAVAFHLAMYAERESIPLAGVIVENTFLSISDMVDHLMPVVAPFKGLVLRIGWDSTKIVPYLRTPILYLAGSDDTLVPHQHMKTLLGLSRSSTKVMMHIIQGGTHNECWMQGGAAYWDAIRDFLHQTAPGAGGGAGMAGMASVSGYNGNNNYNIPKGTPIPTMPTGIVGIAKEASHASGRPSATDINIDKQKNI